MSNVLRVSILMLITALLVAPTSALFAQGVSTQIFLPVATNMSATSQNVEQNIELSTEQFEKLDAFTASQTESEVSALGNDIPCVYPSNWYGYSLWEYTKIGDKGTNVWLAQYYLVNRHNRSLAPWGIDSDFGRTTYNAIREVQQYWKNQGYTACGRTIGVDGSVGSQTWGILVYQRTPPQGSSTGGGTRVQLAQQILNSSRISLERIHVVSRVNDNATAYQQMADTAAGRMATLSSYGNAPGGSVYLGTDFLQHMLTLANSYTYNVTELAGASHSVSSYHYAGKTVDLNYINGIKVNSSNPYYRSFMQSCWNLGAVEVLGPGNAGHSGHVHCSWGR